MTDGREQDSVVLVRADYILPVLGARFDALPSLLLINSMIALLPVYAASVWQQHVWRFLPFIEDLRACAPESCVYAQFANFSSALLPLIFYFHYKITNDCLLVDRPLHVHERSANLMRLRVGLVTSAAFFLSANFSENSVCWLYTVSAWISSCGGLMYWARSVWGPLGCPRRSSITRLLVITAMTGGLLLRFGLLMTSQAALDERDSVAQDCYAPPNAGRMRWSRHDGGHQWLAAAAAGQWVMVLALMALPLTLMSQFTCVVHNLKLLSLKVGRPRQEEQQE